MRLLSELIGYTVSGDAAHAGGAQIVPLLIGRGGSGKGVTLRLLGRLLGQSLIVAVNDIYELAGRFALGNARGAAAIIIADMPEPPRSGYQLGDYQRGAGLIKNISGGDLIRIERKGRDPLTTPLGAQVWTAANAPPRWIRGAADADAWQRRIVAVEFPRSGLGDKHVQRSALEAEIVAECGGGVAAYCLAMYLRAARRAGGLGLRPAFTEPDSSAQVTRRMLTDALGLAPEFIAERLAFGVQGAFTARRDIRAEYDQYLTDNGAAELTNRGAAELYQLIDQRAHAEPSAASETTRRGVRGWASVQLIGPESPITGGGGLIGPDHAD